MHGKTGLDAALRITEALFSGDANDLSEQDLQQLRLDGLPSSTLAADVIDKPLTQLLADAEWLKQVVK